MTAWIVKRNGEETAADVKRSLVDHDGYDPDIEVEREMSTASEFAARHLRKFTVTRVDSRPDSTWDDMRDARHFRITLTGAHGRMSLYFSQGSAHTQDPTAADVLDCLASDASGVENVRDFEDWCADYGYETDSRKAEKTYKAVVRQTKSLLRTLGATAYEELLYGTERL